MCNAYEQHVKWIEYVRMMQALELNIPTQQTELDLPQADDIRINQMGPLMRAAANDNAVELTPMNFGLLSDQPKRGSVFNYRSEGRSFANIRRCLVPASGFFEFNDRKCPVFRPSSCFLFALSFGVGSQDESSDGLRAARP